MEQQQKSAERLAKKRQKKNVAIRLALCASSDTAFPFGTPLDPCRILRVLIGRMAVAGS